MEEKWRDFIKEKRSEYKKIGYVTCPAFGNEKVYFNKYGFDHIVRKGKRLRTPAEQIKRFSLVSPACKLLGTSQKLLTYLERSHKHPVAYFWSVGGIENGKKLTVIVRQLGSGNKHFFSVFDDYILQKAQRPHKEAFDTFCHQL